MSDQQASPTVEPSQDPGDFFVADVLSRIDAHTALQFAFVAQKHSADVGFDFDSILLAMNKVNEELSELDEAFTARESDFQHFAEELGDCFFALVNLCRHAGIDPEELLKANTHKYLDRCFQVENQLRTAGQAWKSASLQEIHAMWRIAKRDPAQVPSSKIGLAGGEDG